MQRDLGEVPEVTRGEPMRLNEWLSFLDDPGRVTDVKKLHERIFRGVCTLYMVRNLHVHGCFSTQQYFLQASSSFGKHYGEARSLHCPNGEQIEPSSVLPGFTLHSLQFLNGKLACRLYSPEPY